MRRTSNGKDNSGGGGSSSNKTATKKPLAADNRVTGAGVVRSMRKLSVNNAEANRTPGPAVVNANRMTMRAVRPTVINALASDESAAAAADDVAQRPVLRAARLPPAVRQPAAAHVRERIMRVASRQPSVAVPPPRILAAALVSPAASNVTRRPMKQLSADRGPPAKGMARCPLCARDFTTDRLPKHEQVCRLSRERSGKRKVFDTSRKRLEAVAAEAGVNVMLLKRTIEKHDQRAGEKLQKENDALAARAVQRHMAAGGTVRNPAPKLNNNLRRRPGVGMTDSDLIKCPHCARTFNEASAERHIPSCAERQRNAAARLRNKKR